MDDELRELCQKVYERLPMWDGTEKCYIYVDEYSPGAYYWKVVPLHEDNVADVDEWHPLYTSDYLLEKLPHTVAAIKGGSNCEAYIVQMGKIKAQRQHADTPLKALLKLALALSDTNKLEKGDV